MVEAPVQSCLYGFEDVGPGAPRASRHGVHRDGYMAAYMAAATSARNDIGDLPEPADPERRARCTASLCEFAETYCGLILEHEPGPRLRLYAETLQVAIEGAGQIHVRMPRGIGKTTWVKAAIAWGLATGRLHYAVVFCASTELASAIIDDVWRIFEDDAFAADFPEIAVPIAQAGGLAQRFAAQHQRGKPTRIKRSAREIHLPTIEGSPSSGAVLVARGAGAKTRGLVRGKRRPDMVLLDDLQSREDARNPNRVKKLVEWIDGDVQGLAGSRRLNAVMTSTPIVEGDLSCRYADAEEHPSWRLVEFHLVEGEAVAPALWDEYAALWRGAVRDGDMTFSQATAFYSVHRAEMDAGLEALDDRKFDERVEVSAIQHAYNLRLTMGEEAYRAECQLQVAASVDAVQITPELVASRLNGSPRGTLPPGTVQAVAFCDVNAVAGISWVIAAFGPHGVGAVVDYGRYPGGGRRLVPEGQTDADSAKFIAAGLAETVRRLLDARLPTPGGTLEKIAAIWIDCGYMRRVVLSVCNVFRQRTGRLVWPAAGVAHDRYNARGRHVIQRGDGVDFRELDGERWFAQDADRGREKAQRSWFGEPLQAGTLSLPGANPREHADFAGEICAEVLSEKTTDSRGIAHYFWGARPGFGNHWLDALAGCIAMAIWYRLLDDAAEAVAPIRAQAEPTAVSAAAYAPDPIRRAERPRRRSWSPSML